MIKNMFLLLIVCSCISCKQENEFTSLNVSNNIETRRLVQDINCKGNTYVMQIPTYTGDTQVKHRLNRDIKKLILSDIQDTDLDIDDSIDEIWHTFINHRKTQLCNGNNTGITNISIDHTTQTDSVISYLINYTQNGIHKRIISSFKKPEITPITMAMLFKPGKETDVKTIYDINMIQSVANLALDVDPDEYNNFKNYIIQNPVKFDAKELETSTIGIKNLSKDTTMLQVVKKIKLPNRFSHLNEDIVIEIPANEMEYYLDLSTIKP